MIVKTLAGIWTRRCPRCLTRLEKTDPQAPWRCACGWPAIDARELRPLTCAVVCTGLVLLLAAACASVRCGPGATATGYAGVVCTTPAPPTR